MTLVSHEASGGDDRKRTIFSDFDSLFPERIINITNGVTPRRWLHHANPALSSLITEQIGSLWVRDLGVVRALEGLAGDAAFRRRFRAAKQANKARLAGVIRARLGLTVDPSSLFDVHVKRIHEYKRQLLNVLHVVTRYNRLRDGRAGLAVPRRQKAQDRRHKSGTR